MAQGRRVVVVSHGPRCLDGVVSAVVVARWHGPTRTSAVFTDHAHVDANLLAIPLKPAPREVWITDIVWADAAAGQHLCGLAERGTRLFWIDHHRTAIARRGTLRPMPPFEGLVLSDARSAAWLTFDYLSRSREGRTRRRGFTDLGRLVALTDDHDRWIHALPGSHELGLTVGEMESEEAYRELLRVDDSLGYTPAMREAKARVDQARRRSLAIARRSRSEEPGSAGRPAVVAALCDGYASEVAALWGARRENTVFALYDLRSSTVSLRRSPGCAVDLSRLAESLSGGGHPAAAGFRPEAVTGPPRPGDLARSVADVLGRGGASSGRASAPASGARQRN
jgi:oligoribonuclease NrnB/cAMP/cGMP phosphodiesterase (DHH superfamily)